MALGFGFWQCAYGRIGMLLLCFLLLLSCHVYGDEGTHILTQPESTGSEAAAAKIVVVRGDGNYPPYEIVAQGKLSGLHMDMIKYAADKLNLIIEVRSLPWKRAVRSFSEGTVDAITFFNHTKKRESYSYFQEGNILSATKNVLLVLAERKDEFVLDHTLRSLGDAIIGVQLGYSYGSRFDGMTYLNKEEVISEQDIEMMLINRRHDLAVMEYQQFNLLKQKGGFKNIVPLGVVIDVTAQYIAFSRTADHDGRRAELAKLFAAEIKALKASADYEKLLKKYTLFH